MLVAAVFGMGGAEGIILERPVSFETTQVVEDFGFYQGGTMDLSVSIKDKARCGDNYAMIITGYNARQVTGSRYTAGIAKRGDACRSELQDYDQSSMWAFKPDGESGSGMSLSVNGWAAPSRNRYSLVLLTCCEDDRTITGDVDVTFMNPGGEHLDYGAIPLKDLYIVLNFLWVFISACYFGNYLHYRERASELQTVLFALPATKLVYLGLAITAWNTLSREGLLSQELLIVYQVSLLVFTVTLYGLLLIIAKGWKVCRERLPLQERQSYGVTVVLITALFVIHLLFAWDNYFALFLVYMTSLAFVISGITRNGRALNAQLALVRQQGIPKVETTPVYLKAQLLRRFQHLTFVYMAWKILSSFMTTVFVDQMWLVSLLDESADVFLWAVLGFLFRPREKDIFNTRLVVERLDNVAAANPQLDGLDGRPMSRMGEATKAAILLCLEADAEDAVESNDVVPEPGLSSSAVVPHKEHLVFGLPTRERKNSLHNLFMHGWYVPHKTRHRMLSEKLMTMLQGSYVAPPDEESSEIFNEGHSFSSQGEEEDAGASTNPQDGGGAVRPQRWGSPSDGPSSEEERRQEQAAQVFSSAFKRMEKIALHNLRSSRGHPLPTTVPDAPVSTTPRRGSESDSVDTEGSLAYAQSPARHTRRPSSVVIEMNQVSPPRDR